MNKIEKFKKVFLIYGSFTKFSPIKVTQALLPIYVKKNYYFLLKFKKREIFDKQALRSDLIAWLDKAKELLNINSELHHVFLINGVPINFLCEIPLECNVLIVDIFGKCNFWLNVLKFHKIMSLSKAKTNFLMHYLNTRKGCKEIILFLNDRSKFNTIKNEIDSVFDKFQGDDGLMDLKKAEFFTSKKLKQTILDILDRMENSYFINLDTTGHFGADKDQMIDAHYKKIMDQTLKDIYEKIHEAANEDSCKVKPNDIETKYFIDDNKLSTDEKNMIGKKLSFLLKSYEKDFNSKLRKQNLVSIEKKLKEKNLDQKDYISGNIEK